MLHKAFVLMDQNIVLAFLLLDINDDDDNLMNLISSKISLYVCRRVNETNVREHLSDIGSI